MLRSTIGWSLSLYWCNNAALTAYSEASGSITNGFMESGSLKTGEKHNAYLNYSKHYICYYFHYHYLLVLSKSDKGAATVAKSSINLLLVC